MGYGGTVLLKLNILFGARHGAAKIDAGASVRPALTTVRLLPPTKSRRCACQDYVLVTVSIDLEPILIRKLRRWRNGFRFGRGGAKAAAAATATIFMIQSINSACLRDWRRDLALFYFAWSNRVTAADILRRRSCSMCHRGFLFVSHTRIV